MKKRFLAGILIFSVILFVSCKKVDLSRPIITTSQWQYANATYNCDTTYFSGGTLISHDKTLDEIHINFQGRPAESGTYTVSSFASGPVSSTDCTIDAGFYQLGFKSFKSVGTERDLVQVTVSDLTQKITAQFLNVTVIDNSGAVKYVSGTIIEK